MPLFTDEEAEARTASCLVDAPDAETVEGSLVDLHRSEQPGAAESFLEALSVRDFHQLAACLAPAARARMLLPRGAEELVGRDQITRRLDGWFGSATEFQVLSTAHDEVGARRRLIWRLRLVRDGRSWELIEQVAFVDPGPDGIRQIDLLCSGFLPEKTVSLFDAGAMGCADGLAPEFRRRISSIAIGSSLVTLVRDPAAREDLPPLARMLGHSVTSVESQDDGSFRITVERRR
jgi:TusA-related sulfurtransferase